MLNLDTIKAQYKRLLEDGNRELLPLEKVIELEKAKLELLEGPLKGIVSIDGEFNLIKEQRTISYAALLERVSPLFGAPNFDDRRTVGAGRELVMAFNHAVITIVYKNKTVRVKIDLYWDN